jgi:hypothetical protein
MLFVLAFRSDVTRRAPRHGISCVHERFALEKRAGILPNRDAGSKRKLSGIFAQTSQNVHSFSTADFPVASPKKIMTDYFVKFKFREISWMRRCNWSETLLIRTREFIHAERIYGEKNAVGLDKYCDRLRRGRHLCRSATTHRPLPPTVLATPGPLQKH